MTRQSPAAERSVLLAFRGENVRSFRDEFELSMLATGLAEPGAVWPVRWREGGQPVNVLPAAGVFGANGSGKSNVLKAMDDMRWHVLHSFRSASPTGGVHRRPFMLDPGSRVEPSRFEIDIVLRDVRYEYGFSIDDERVLDEWAYRYPKGRAAVVFRRTGDDVELGPTERAHGRVVLKLLRPNALFLSTAASANHPVLLPLYEWFATNLRIAEAESRHARQALTTRMLDDESYRKQVLALLQAADLGITGARTYEIPPELKERIQRAVRILNGQEGDPETLEEMPDIEQMGVELRHRGTQGDVSLHPSDESLGTLVWFGLAGPVVQALAEGSVLLADELDASLHPSLVAELVRLFQRSDTNPHQAQLVFNSHDATLLGDAVSDRLIGRDQIWFTEKDDDGSTRLYPLSDLKPRKEESVGRRYLDGRYGARPILSVEEFAAAARLISAGDAR
ncbi:AAA family ATPase [Phytoactinopolyspora halotolerans]|uniref:ATP-binding protein n=1 Tax=Phytoactinopolyspora halotolerans TaxID=1981512 RepID=A0A6L9SH79_9ACTN|nr:ATP-binding protein [Phytoactinopolyspora halotolerans]NEE03782.1 ATP-binding protein [Phytoactinopolyspora halotolerans]